MVEQLGVFAIPTYEDEQFAVPTGPEDQDKDESVVNKKRPFLMESLRDSLLGFLGGKVEADENPEEALKREIIEELKSLLEFQDGFDLSEFKRIFSILVLEDKTEITDFIVIQNVMDSNGDKKERGPFELLCYKLVLTKEQYEYLLEKNIIFSLDNVNKSFTPEIFRPYVRHYLEGIENDE